MKFILASQSPYRLELLQKLGLKVEAQKPLVDEEKLKSKFMPLGPMGVADALAKAKAESLRELFPEAWILGGDQLVLFENQILGKTPDPQSATNQLLRLQGRSHQLITSIFISGPNSGPHEDFEHQNVTTLVMKSLTEKQIQEYIRQDQPFDCAGTYKIEKSGICLFERIETDDFTAIQGLPMMAFSRFWQSEFQTLPFEISSR